MVLQKDRDWLNNIRDMQEHRKQRDRRGRQRVIADYQETIAEKATDAYLDGVSDELSEEDSLVLGQAIFEAVGEDRWNTLREEVNGQLKEQGLTVPTERLPQTREIVAEQMIEEVGESQIEMWGREITGVAPA